MGCWPSASVFQERPILLDHESFFPNQRIWVAVESQSQPGLSGDYGNCCSQKSRQFVLTLTSRTFSLEEFDQFSGIKAITQLDMYLGIGFIMGSLALSVVAISVSVDHGNHSLSRNEQWLLSHANKDFRGLLQRELLIEVSYWTLFHTLWEFLWDIPNLSWLYVCLGNEIQKH